MVNINCDYPLLLTYKMYDFPSTAHSRIASGSVSPRPAIRKTRNTLYLDREATPPAGNFTNPVRDDSIEDDFNYLVQ